MSTNPRARAWVEVDADALRRNYAQVARAAGPGARLVPVLKADAYGLGAERALRVFEPENPWGYGVATVDEGLSLRALGVERPIVVLAPAPLGCLEEALGARLDLSVSSLAALGRIAGLARDTGARARVHLEVDTGMGRAGFAWNDVDAWLPPVMEQARGHVDWVGCFTHAHSADEDADSVHEQWRRFTGVLERIGAAFEGRGETPPELLIHAMNSAGSLRTPEYAADAVRPGIFLYGGLIGEGQPAPSAVASVRARVVHLRDAPAGTTVGYGATYRAAAAERWATLAIGYADGLPRALGNRGSALVHGVRVPIIGRVSMDVTVVNITGAPGVGLGDIATLIGADGDEEITVDEVAELAGTISYEILTGLTKRLPRVWTGVDGS